MKLAHKSGIVVAVLLLPSLASAAGGIVPCGNPGQAVCTFGDFFQLADNFLKFALFDLVIPLATLSLAIAGFRYIAAFGNENEAKKVHDIVFYTIMGVILT